MLQKNKKDPGFPGANQLFNCGGQVDLSQSTSFPSASAKDLTRAFAVYRVLFD